MNLRRIIPSSADPVYPHRSLLPFLFSRTGIRWEWYCGDRLALGLEGSWQLMPEDPRDENDFWWWHLENSRQWFDSPHDAARSLLQSWDAYRQRYVRPPDAAELKP